MKLTPFGKAIRVLRIELDIKPKDLANKLNISLSYLGAIELGRKRLTEQHLNSTIDFLKNKISDDQIKMLIIAAEESNLKINTTELSIAQKGLVNSFVRRLKEGQIPNYEVINWLNNGTNPKQNLK